MVRRGRPTPLHGTQLYDGTNQLLGGYVGDSNYQLSYSPLFSLGEHTSDFTLAATTQNIALPPGGSGIGFVQLQGWGRSTEASV
jgi:hypothetical protein